MTEQAPPDYYFQNIIFNPKYYDNEVNNNITIYEANNTYLKKPINTGLVNSVLTLTNTTTKEMQWTSPAVAITNYVNYDSGTSSLISNVSGTPTTITSINTTGTLQSRGLTIKNASNVDVSTITIAGAITGTSLSAGTGTISTSGAINGGAITGTSLSGGNGLISTTNLLQSRGLTVKNTSNADVCTISNLGALVCTSIQNNNNTLNCGNITSGTINSGAINANANLIETTGNIQSRGLTIKNVSNTNVLTISNVGNINVSGAYSGANYIYTSSGDIQTASGDIYTNTGELRSRRLVIKNTSDAIVATISNLGALVCTSIQNNNNTLNCGNITSGSINSGAINANANLIETTGNLQSRGLAIKNASNVDVATISNLGALVCTSIQNNNNTLNCGNITSGSINSGAINTNNNNINIGSGSLTASSGYVNCAVVNCSTGLNYTGGQITAYGAFMYLDGLYANGLSTGVICERFVCGGINNCKVQGIICQGDIAVKSTLTGPITASILSNGLISTTGAVNSVTINTTGLITAGSINSGSGLIETTGNLQSRGLIIKNTSNANVATISNTGELVCSSLNSSSGLIQTTGNVRSRGLTIRNTLNTDVATISNLGALDCKSVNSSSGLIQTTGHIQSRGLIIQNATPSTIASIGIDGAITCTSVNAGFGSLTGLRLNAQDIEIIPAVITNTAYVGYTYSVNSTTINYNSGTTRAIDLNNSNLIDGANYLVRYQVLINSGTTSRALTSIAHGLTNTGSAVSSVNTIKYEPGCWTYEKLNSGAEVINDRLFQGSFFYRYNSANAYTVACVLSFTVTGSLSLTVSATAIRII